MAEKDATEIPSWLRPVYEEKIARDITKYQVCKYCREVKGDHFFEDLKCPFAASTFAPDVINGNPLYLNHETE